MKNIVFAFLFLFLCSCAAMNKPAYDLPVSYDQSAPPEWKLGWQHGCESGLSAYGNNYFKSMYKFKQDISMIKNDYYFKAWNDAFNFCRASINRSLAGDEKGYQATPELLSTTSLDITNNKTRYSNSTYNTSVFGGGGESDHGFFSSLFDVKTPGYGSTAWGASVDHCDWLNRCGSDKPKDPMDAIMGQ